MAIPEKTESEIILFRFTAYLQTAISNSVNEYYRERQRQLATEQAYSAQFFIDAELEVCIDPNDFSTAISENDMLDRALSILDAKQRYILYQHIVNGKSFTEISAVLHLKYKTVTALYYRTLQKLKRELDRSNGFQGIIDSMPKRRSRRS